jgi:hypothetical protein
MEMFLNEHLNNRQTSGEDMTNAAPGKDNKPISEPLLPLDTTSNEQHAGLPLEPLPPSKPVNSVSVEAMDGSESTKSQISNTSSPPNRVVVTCLRHLCSFYDWSLMDPRLDLQGLVVGGYRLVNVVSGDGSHGVVVLCVDSHNTRYAMKIERYEGAMRKEGDVLESISSYFGEAQDLHIPRLHQTFKKGGKAIMVMDLLGPNLDNLWYAMNQSPMTMKTTLQIGLSLLKAYQHIHRTGWLHLTTKPANFCIGGTAETRQKIYVVDFGRAEEWWSNSGAGHRGTNHPSTRGVTSEYSSIWRRTAAGRRDEIMSLGLMLMHFASARIYPWASSRLSKAKWVSELVYSAWKFARSEKPMHSATDVRSANFAHADIHVEGAAPFEDMVVYAANLEYEERPDYDLLSKRLRQYAKLHQIPLDGKFDWDDMVVCDANGRMVMKAGARGGMH